MTQQRAHRAKGKKSGMPGRSKTIRVGMIGCGRRALWYSAIFDRIDPEVYAELDPGDVLFFHCNVLHRSDQNRSELPRWSLICCYNARHNDKYKMNGSDHPGYSPLERWPDEKIVEIGKRDRPSGR